MYMNEHVVDLKQQSMNLLLVHSNASKLTTEACRYKKSKKFFVNLLQNITTINSDICIATVVIDIIIPISLFNISILQLFLPSLI